MAHQAKKQGKNKSKKGHVTVDIPENHGDIEALPNPQDFDHEDDFNLGHHDPLHDTKEGNKPTSKTKIDEEHKHHQQQQQDKATSQGAITTGENKHKNAKHDKKSRDKKDKKKSIVPDRPAKSNNWKCCRSFPCCLGLPLEIGIQLLCVVDLIYSIMSLVLWSILLGMDLFSHKSTVGNKTEVFYPPTIQRLDPFGFTTTPKTPPWTIRPVAIPERMYDYEAVDLEIASRHYSKIAEITTHRHEEIEEVCGNSYLEKYLFTYELEKTENIWQDFLRDAAIAELIFILISTFLIMSVCCFIEHRGSKLLVMILWWLEWIPMFLEYEAIILSQSKRLCILEYVAPDFRGQLFLLIFLAIRSFLFKPYQLLVHYCYIKELLVYGYLKDESIHPTQETAYSKEYFSQFYAKEGEREDGAEEVEALMATNTSHALAFDTLRHSDVATVQHNVMTAKEDPLTVRNRETRDLQSGKKKENIKSVRHS